MSIDTNEETPEAPEADQPEENEVTPESGTSDEEASEPTETEDAPENDEESFTDVNADDLPTDVRARYGQMQADYTRKTQALAERHQELDGAISLVTDLVTDTPTEEQTATQEAVFRTLAERLGYELEPEGEPDSEPESPEPEIRDPRLDPILAERQAAMEQKAAEEHERHLDTVEEEITSGITALAQADGIELSEHEMDVIFDGVLALPPADDGPAVQAAYARYKLATKAHTDRWVNSKRSTLAPGGPAAGSKPDLSTSEGRIAHAARAVEAAQRS